MLSKPRIAIVGAGNLGSALAVALRRAEYPIDRIVVRLGSLRGDAARLARKVSARISTGIEGSRANLIWFCVPDSQIAPAADALATQVNWKGRVALHSSGALTSDELSVLRNRGATVASAHALMTFVHGTSVPLREVPFTVEGDSAAVRAARRVIDGIGGVAHSIRKQDKAAYHLWATFASPLMTALFATAEQVASIAHIPSAESRKRVIPMLQQTLDNYARLGAADGFSGPIIRGDSQTVERHLHELKDAPVAREVYVALARAALRFLPSKRKSALKRLLGSR